MQIDPKVIFSWCRLKQVEFRQLFLVIPVKQSKI